MECQYSPVVLCDQNAGQDSEVLAQTMAWVSLCQEYQVEAVAD